MELRIWESKDYLAVNKPCKSHYNELDLTRSGAKSPFTAWEPVHRLDFETSGLLLFARPDLVEATRSLFQNPESSLKKLYLAGAVRELPENFTHGRPITGGLIGSRYRSSKKVRFSFDKNDFKGWHSVRPASQSVRPASDAIQKSSFKGVLYEVELHTGARHQIRAFFAAQNAPLVGDPLYGEAQEEQPLELHSWKLEFAHPVSGELIRLEAPLP